MRLFATNCETFGDRVQTTKWFPTNTDAISSPGSDTVTCIAATNSSDRVIGKFLIDFNNGTLLPFLIIGNNMLAKGSLILFSANT